jgi:DNA-binding CsgD family transcriptional regulator
VIVETQAERLDRTLSEAIRTVGEVSFSSNLARFLRLCMPFDNFIILAYRGQQNPVVLYREFRDPIVYQAMDSEYLTANYVLDPFYKAHIDGVNSGLHRLFDLAPDRFKQSSYFELYYEKTTLIDEVAAFAKTKTGLTITACMGTDRTSGRFFNKRHLADLDRHNAVISCLLELHWNDYDITPKERDVTNIPLVERLRKALVQNKGISLSPRQSEVAIFILQGHSSKSISLNLGISAATVKVFRKQLYAKCNLSSQAELFAMILPMLSSVETTNPQW